MNVATSKNVVIKSDRIVEVRLGHVCADLCHAAQVYSKGTGASSDQWETAREILIHERDSKSNPSKHPYPYCLSSVTNGILCPQRNTEIPPLP